MEALVTLPRWNYRWPVTESAMRKTRFVWEEKSQVLMLAVPWKSKVFAVIDGEAEVGKVPTTLRISHSGYLNYDHWTYGNVKLDSSLPINGKFMIKAGQLIGHAISDNFLLACNVTSGKDPDSNFQYNKREHPITYLKKYGAIFPDDVELPVNYVLYGLGAAVVIGVVVGVAKGLKK